MVLEEDRILCKIPHTMSVQMKQKNDYIVW